MKEYQKVINRLKGYDLSNYPYDDIKKDIAILRFGLMGMVLHRGKCIIRARPNDKTSPFNTREANQYPPPESNTKFRRASSPNNTMFYGAEVPDEVNDSNNTLARCVATAEVSELLNPKNMISEGEEKITYSTWVVKEDITLIAMCYKKDFITNSPKTAELYKLYQSFLRSFPKDFVDDSMLVTEYLAHEFGKPNLSDLEHEYLVSAAFTDLSTNFSRDGVNPYNGIYYPSVRANGIGYNVAIHPDYCDKYLQLVSVGECTIYKYPCGVTVDNDTVCKVKDDTKPFTLEPVAPQFHIGREKVIADLKAQCK